MASRQLGDTPAARHASMYASPASSTRGSLLRGLGCWSPENGLALTSSSRVMNRKNERRLDIFRLAVAGAIASARGPHETFLAAALAIAAGAAVYHRAKPELRIAAADGARAAAPA